MDKKGDPWFVAQDVAAVLEFSRPADALRMVDDDDKSLISQKDALCAGFEVGSRGILIVNESGVYQIIFQSNKPEAKAFKKWVTSVVLPAIRKTGGYILGEEYMNEDEDELVLAAIQVQQRKIELLRKELADAAPKAERYDAFLDSDGNLTVDKTAKAMSKKLGIDIGRNRLFKFLRLYKFLRQNNSPYQQWIERGYFTTILTQIRNGDVVAVTLVTPKGFDRIVTDFVDFMENGPKQGVVMA